MTDSKAEISVAESEDIEEQSLKTGDPQLREDENPLLSSPTHLDSPLYWPNGIFVLMFLVVLPVIYLLGRFTFFFFGINISSIYLSIILCTLFGLAIIILPIILYIGVFKLTNRVTL